MKKLVLLFAVAFAMTFASFKTDPAPENKGAAEVSENKDASHDTFAKKRTRHYRSTQTAVSVPTVDILYKWIFETDLSSPKEVEKVSGLKLAYREKQTSGEYYGNFTVCIYGNNIKVKGNCSNGFQYTSTGEHAFFLEAFNDVHYWLCAYSIGFKDKSDYESFVQELYNSSYYSEGKFGEKDCNLYENDETYCPGWYVIVFNSLDM